MAKIQGLTGRMSGKMGNVVFRVRRGTQVVSNYNPYVTNPRSDGQQSGRAKFKLMSQLAGALAPVLAIPYEGGVSPRNIFLKKNYPLTSARRDEDTAEYVASVQLSALQLTNGQFEIPEITAGFQRDTVSVNLNDTTQNCSIIHYVVLLVTPDRSTPPAGLNVNERPARPPRIIGTGMGTITDEDPVARAEIQLALSDIPAVNDTIVVLAYGEVLGSSVTRFYDNVQTEEDSASVPVMARSRVTQGNHYSYTVGTSETISE